jgi:diguanylate cyclase (GGDEF)-like protein/PAS domain S-box-containing protein
MTIQYRRSFDVYAPRSGMAKRRRGATGAVAAGDVSARLSAIEQGSDDAIIATRLDGVVTAWNPAAEELYGYAAHEIIGRNIAAVYPDSEMGQMAAILESVRRGETNNVTEGTRRRADGSLVEVEVRVSPIFDESGAVIGTSSFARSTADRRRREQELRESRESLAYTQAIGRIGAWRAGFGPEKILTLTPETYRIIGVDAGRTLRNIDFYNQVHPDDRELLIETVLKVRSEGSSAELELRLAHPDGSTRWLSLAMDAQRTSAGTVGELTGVVHDVTERKGVELRMARDALYDQLTGLATRGLFLDRAQRGVARALRNGSNIAILYVDLDRFTLFNGARGNECGDLLLCAVAERLQSLLRVTDTVGRFGADEYGIVCENIATAAAAAERVERILAAIAEPYALEGGDAFITASIGVAVSGPGSSAEALLRDAHLAMHRAKERGRNRFELYDYELRREVEQRFALEASLRRALDAGQLYLEFQPIMSLTARRFVGAEALVRWKHPERGLVQPNDFIPLAEENGLIVPIGTWVLEAACRQLRDWRAATPGHGHWSMSVNVAAVQLRSHEFPGIVERALADAGLEPAALCLELTESVLIDNAVVSEVLERLRQIGVRISIDDFGTKYSSLSYLTRLNIDELKIDQSFIDGLAEDDSKRAIVSAILAIGTALDIPVTAEGVETEAQLVALRRLGCETVQGFYFARPLSAAACLAALGRPAVEMPTP